MNRSLEIQCQFVRECWLESMREALTQGFPEDGDTRCAHELDRYFILLTQCYGPEEIHEKLGEARSDIDRILGGPTDGYRPF